jgi:hypothetical protein
MASNARPSRIVSGSRRPDHVSETEQAYDEVVPGTDDIPIRAVSAMPAHPEGLSCPVLLTGPNLRPQTGHQSRRPWRRLPRP